MLKKICFALLCLIMSSTFFPAYAGETYAENKQLLIETYNDIKRGYDMNKKVIWSYTISDIKNKADMKMVVDKVSTLGFKVTYQGYSNFSESYKISFTEEAVHDLDSLIERDKQIFDFASAHHMYSGLMGTKQ